LSWSLALRHRLPATTFEDRLGSTRAQGEAERFFSIPAVPLSQAQQIMASFPGRLLDRQDALSKVVDRETLQVSLIVIEALQLESFQIPYSRLKKYEITGPMICSCIFISVQTKAFVLSLYTPGHLITLNDMRSNIYVVLLDRDMRSTTRTSGQTAATTHAYNAQRTQQKNGSPK